ncbi:MAG: glycine--tRNA ligase [Bacteroidota bacterium]|nr:glycine--tRNA ligase [Bacteroidota bacterium]
MPNEDIVLYLPIMAEADLQKIVSHCKEYGFIFPSSEIYDNLGAVYDYGPFGVELKNHIKEYWWKSMVQLHENIVGLDSAIFMHPTTWKASGHVDSFSDPLIDNKDSKKRYRADVLLEEKIDKLKEKGEKELTKKGIDLSSPEEDKAKASRDYAKGVALEQEYGKAAEAADFKRYKELIEEYEIACEVSGSRNWTDVRQFNLMFATKMGALDEAATDLYLRPETAQGIFVNFLNVQKTARMKVPFGIAQIGKAFRNEIVARQFIFRMREFEQMEMQFFVRPGTELEWFKTWKETRMNWHLALGTPQENLRFHVHEKLAHYANAAEDIQFKFPIGFKELEGIHSRTDFDLTEHQKFSGKKLQYFDSELNQNYVPYVIETSIGLDRMFLRVLSECLKDETLENGETRTVLKLPPALAPIKVAVLPLVKKDGLAEKAREIFDTLKFTGRFFYEEKDTIGKRYRRMDAIGTPYCITVDHQTLEDNTVTIRERDSMSQERIAIADIEKTVGVKIDMNNLLRKAIA